MTNFAPRKWEYEESVLGGYSVYEGNTEIANVQEEQNARLIASAPELYWMVYNLLFELKQGNGSNSEYIKQAIPQMGKLLNSIQKWLEELKPCPFCGGKAEIMTELRYGERYFWVRCENCCVYTLHVAGPEAASRRWNRRTQS